MQDKAIVDDACKISERLSDVRKRAKQSNGLVFCSVYTGQIVEKRKSDGGYENNEIRKKPELDEFGESVLEHGPLEAVLHGVETLMNCRQ